jgi:hypothetical protein
VDIASGRASCCPVDFPFTIEGYLSKCNIEPFRVGELNTTSPLQKEEKKMRMAELRPFLKFQGCTIFIGSWNNGISADGDCDFS